jgi:hypothetical protein
MDTDDVKQLDNGDEVFWTDPDGGACSRLITIGAIAVNGDVVQITSKDGDYLECFAEELS